MAVRFVSALSAALVAVLLTAASAEARERNASPPDGFYGVMWDRSAMEAPASLADEQFALMRRSGVESIRATFSWEDAQPIAGRPPSFDATDRIVELGARSGISILPVVIYTPYWARAHLEASYTSQPTRVRYYARYLEELVLRYGPSGSFWEERTDLPQRPIRDWQIWNEPNLPHFFWTGVADRWARPLRPTAERVVPSRQAGRSGRSRRSRRSRQRLLARDATASPVQAATAVRRRLHQPLHLESRQRRAGHATGPCRP